jgi:hypothetical protein
MRARPRGARLHDYWQQASKRGAANEVRLHRDETAVHNCWRIPVHDERVGVICAVWSSRRLVRRALVGASVR